MQTATDHQLPRSDVTFCAKLVDLSLDQEERSYILEKACLFIEYAQLVSITFEIFSSDPDMSSAVIPQFLRRLSEIVSFTWFFSLNESNQAKLYTIYSICLSFVLTKLLLFLYISVLVIKNERPKGIVVLGIWRWIYKFQGRIIYFITASVCCKIIQATQKLSTTSFDYYISGICYSIIVIEYIFSLFIDIKVFYLFPNHKLLASKSNEIEIMTLTCKFILRCVQIQTFQSEIKIWICTCTSAIFSLFRIMYHFRKFPLYKLKALRFKSLLLVTVATLDLCSLIILSLDPIRDNIDKYNSIITFVWIIMTPFSVIISNNYFSRITNNLISKASSLNDLLLKLSIIKHISKSNRKLNNHVKKHSIFQLLPIFGKHINEVFQINDNQSLLGSMNFSNKEGLNHIIACYLEKIVPKFPKNKFIRLYAAYYYGEKLKLNKKAITILSDVKREFSDRKNINLSLLEVRIQRKILNRYYNQPKKLDLLRFIQDTAKLNELKKEMISQADLQIELYQHKIKDIGNILQYSQFIDAKRIKISKMLPLVIATTSPHYLEPLLIGSYYHLFLNHSTNNYNTYYQEFLSKHQRFLAEAKGKGLDRLTLYNSETIFLKLKVENNDDIQISHCSKTPRKLLGWCHEEMVGKNIKQIFPYFPFSSCVQSEGTNKFCNEIHQSYAYHRNGTLIVVDCFVDIDPVIDKGFQLNMLVKPRKSSLEYLIVDKYGTIISSTLTLASRAGLISLDEPCLRSGVNVKFVSNDLGEIDMNSNVLNLNDYSEKEDGGEDKVNNISKATLKQTKAFLKEGFDDCQNETQTAGYDILSLQKYKKIYEDFKQFGQVVNLSLYRFVGSEDIRTNIKQTFSYLCKLVYVHDDQSKIYSLETQNKSDITHRSSCEYQEDYKLEVLANFKEPHRPRRSEEQEESVNLKFGSVNEANSLRTSARLIDENISSMQTRTHYTTKIIEKQPIGISKLERDGLSKKEHLDNPIRNNSLKESREMKPKIETSATRINQPSSAVISNESSEGSNHQIESKWYTSALNSKYYSKPNLIFIRLFYSVLLITFTSQITFQIIMNNTFETLIARKDILRSAESINSLLIRIQRDMRFIIDSSEKKLDEAKLTEYSSSTPILLSKINDYLNNIVIEDHNILEATSFLDEEDQKRVFQRSVQINYTNSTSPQENFFILSRFQYLSKIIDMGYSAVEHAKTNITSALPNFQFLLTNNPNDFLVESEAISETFLEIPKREGEENLIALLINCSIASSFLVLSFFGALYILYTEYQNEKQTLFAFARARKDGINPVLVTISEFKVLLQNDNIYNPSQVAELYKESQRLRSFKASHISKQDDITNLNYKSVQIKYFFYTLRFFILLLVLASLLIVDLVIYENRIQTTDTKLNELYFADRTRSRLNIGVTTAFELLSENDTNFIRNEPSGIQFQKILNDIRLTTEEIATKFKNDNSIQAIQEIIFEDGCKFLTTQSSYNECTAARKGSSKTSLRAVISSLESSLQLVKEQFDQSNRSCEALNQIMIDMFPKTVVPNRVVYSLATLLGTMINQSFENDIKQTQKNERFVALGLDLLFVLVSWVVWFNVLRKVKETDNELKKVIRTLPLNLILSNFVLKSKLLKTISNSYSRFLHE